MHENRVPSLKIRNLEIYPPIIQGGMGVRVSGANLAVAVANTGCAGVIASAGLGFFDGVRGADARKLGQDVFRAEIRKARHLTNGPIGVNILVALTDYEILARAAAEEKADMIISGAGLPLGLPGYVGDSDIALIPIVSSARTFNIICRRWQAHFQRLPDAVVVEGPMAGGHLGYSKESLADHTAATLEQTVVEVVEAANAFTPRIPVVAGGGIFDGADIARFLDLGASGVQMATRFVCTDECDVHENFKRAYMAARQEDITIIESPVGLPGRVIDNAFVASIKQGKTMPFSCKYNCLRSCDPRKAPYCIAEVLAKAAQGRLDEAFAFAGSNAWRCHEIVPVKKLVETLMAELMERRTASRPGPGTISSLLEVPGTPG
jgi:nitronate monooxygenase